MFYINFNIGLYYYIMTLLHYHAERRQLVMPRYNMDKQTNFHKTGPDWAWMTTYLSQFVDYDINSLCLQNGSAGIKHDSGKTSVRNTTIKLHLIFT